jgi:hypothetical protein
VKHIVAAIAASLALVACQTNPITPPSVEVAVLQADTGLDATYNTAAQTYLAVKDSLPADVHAQAKALLIRAYQVVQAADAAQKLGDATTFNQQFAQASALIGQVQALLKH